MQYNYNIRKHNLLSRGNNIKIAHVSQKKKLAFVDTE